MVLEEMGVAHCVARLMELLILHRCTLAPFHQVVQFLVFQFNRLCKIGADIRVNHLVCKILDNNVLRSCPFNILPA
jgi:hypothetical protein